MITHSHYDRDTLVRFLEDAEPENSSDIALHLEECHDCQSTLESMLGDGLTMEAVGELLRNEGANETLDEERTESGHLTQDGRWSFLDPSQHPDSLGRFARFEIMEILGRGGMGIVMRGYDTSLNRHSAVKVLAPELATNAAARKRFSREARSAAAVVHPHVVPIQTVDQHNGLPYLVMPVVEGQSVDARVRNHGPVQIIEAVRIAAQVAEGLAAAHGQGLVHRDIKPANVLLENGVERVQITDFGLARAIDDASMTRSGVIAGTPQYMSPEQAHGDSIDHRSDLFSLGSLIYFMLTGHSPFRAETTMGVLNRIGNEQPRSLRSINADLPVWFEEIIVKLLAKPREDRFQTAAEVAELLQRWHAHLQQPDIVAPPENIDQKSPSSATAPGREGGWAKWLVATAALGFFALAGALIVLELDKGTLTIESDAGDVPIRIMRGDKVVKQLTVTHKGTSVRVASGKYVVSIDGKFDDIQVESGAVTLGRRDTQTVRIVQSRDAAANTGNVSGASRIPEALTGTLTPQQIIAQGQQLAQIKNESIRTEFRVGNVAQQHRGENLGKRWYLCSDDAPSELGVGSLKIWISPAVESALQKEGITDFRKYFTGKTVNISGQVTSSLVMIFGRPNIWTYSMELKTRDQLTVLGQQGDKSSSTTINTPSILAALKGRWQEVEHDEGKAFNQTLVFSGGALGQWYERAQTLPVSITYYVEGAELVLQFYHEPEKSFDFRMKQLRFTYELKGDSLVLTRDGTTTRLQRIRDASAEPKPTQTSPEKQPATPWPAFENPTPVTSVNSPSPVRTLAGRVNWFNQKMLTAGVDASQPLLSVDELTCFARWKLQTDKQLAAETKSLLTDIGIGRWLPDGWSIEGGEYREETDEGISQGFRIQLVSSISGTKVIVRQRFLSPPPGYLVTAASDNDDDLATPLAAAITEFNAIHNQVDGLRQPPVTVNEVLAAIVDWNSRRSQAPVDNKTFAKFQEISKTHLLPSDTKFEVIPSVESLAGDSFKIWSVRILMPQAAKPEWTFAFTIREQYVTVNSALESKIHWGKPNDDGLQAGFRLIPGQREYQIGQAVETEFFYRSISGEPIPATLPNIRSHKKLIALDANGNELDVVEVADKTIGGAVQTSIGETPTSKAGKTLQLGFITPDPNYDSLSPRETYLTVKGVPKAFLTYVVSDLSGGELRTGEASIDIAELLPAQPE